LTNLRIDEISAVDVGAGEGVKIAMMKRNSPTPDFYKIFGAKKPKDFGGYPMPGMSKNLDVPVDPDGPINPGGDDADDANARRARGDADDESHDDQINDTSGEPTRHLNELVEQLEQKEERAMKSKSLDVIKVCKAMVSDGDAYGTSEHELVDWLDRYAKAHDTTFVALYERNDDIGLAIRKAVDIAKNAQWLEKTSTMSKAQPQFSADRSSEPFHAAGAVGGPAGRPGRATLAPRVTGGRAARAVDDPRSALDELAELVAIQRKNNPELTEAGAFARVYEDPKNASLAARERAENRPQASW
jgi:hypothetical protein